MKLLKRSVINVITEHAIDYPTPINFNYWYNFGSLALVCLLLQFITGIFLATAYLYFVNYESKINKSFYA